jgi:hypothetical protein
VTLLLKRKENGFLKNVYLTKVENIESDFKSQGIGLIISRFISKTKTFTALVMRPPGVDDRYLVLFLFKKNHFRCIYVKQFPKERLNLLNWYQPLPHGAIFVLIQFFLQI